MKNEIQKSAVGYISGALGLVAGLAWNDAITTAINALFPISKDAVWMKFGYAIGITILVVLAVMHLSKILSPKEDK